MFYQSLFPAILYDILGQIYIMFLQSNNSNALIYLHDSTIHYCTTVWQLHIFQQVHILQHHVRTGFIHQEKPLNLCKANVCVVFPCQLSKLYCLAVRLVGVESWEHLFQLLLIGVVNFLLEVDSSWPYQSWVQSASIDRQDIKLKLTTTLYSKDLLHSI